MNDQDLATVAYVGFLCGIAGYFLGRMMAAKDSEHSRLQSAVWTLEAKDRKREYDAAVARGEVPAPIGTPLGY
jgi:hypothetical protein